MMRFLSTPLLVVLACSASPLLFKAAADNIPPSSPVAAGDTVEVDLGRELGPVTGRASGILHSFSRTGPPDERVAPLKPHLFRGRLQGVLECYRRLHALGIRHIQLVLSDGFNYNRMHDQDGWPGDHGDWSGWEKTVEDEVASIQAAGIPVEYDVWNEPDNATFWNRDWDQYLETWRRTVLLIRRLDPKAVIVGPSEAHFHEEWMREFLRFAAANKVMPDIVSWHELENDFPYQRIESHAAFVRTILRENGVASPRISIHETLGEYVHQVPGAIAGSLAALETVDVESAARTCWEERPGQSDGSNDSLDGLLTDPAQQPRASWWVYKAYADLAGVLVGTQATERASALASLDGDRKAAHLLLGRFRGDDGPLRVTVRGLGRLGVAPGKTLHVTTRYIPDTGWRSLPVPEPLFEGDVTAREDAVDFSLNGLGRNDACVVDIRPSP